MNIVIAIDSFKGSLSSLQANKAVADSALKLGHTPITFAVADGGEGLLDALCKEQVSVRVTGPLFEEVNAKYGVRNNTAVIEIAKAAGLTLVEPDKRDPLNTTTYGVGEIIKDALGRGCRKFIVGIGGSATNDGGMGMLAALGCRFLDENGKAVPLNAKGLKSLAKIDRAGLLPLLSECEFTVACDVKNPLCGENGCSRIFAMQKGATEESISLMDKWLENYAALSGGNKDMPGAGAAGGLGYGFAAFLDARLSSGIDIVLSEIGIEEHIKTADLVITGEGKLDSQSAYGKTPVGVARLAKKYGKKVIAFCGRAECADMRKYGIDALYEISPPHTPLQKAMAEAYTNLGTTAYRVLKGMEI